MRERRVLWVVLAGFVVGLLAVAGLAAVDDDDPGGPPRLPALAAGAAATAEGGVAADSMLRIGPVEYRVAGSLPSLADRASAWEVGAAVDEADVRELADALGIDAPVRAQDGGFRVRTDDRELFVALQAGAPWNLGPATVDCGPDVPVSSEDDTRAIEERCATVSSGSVSSGSVSSGSASSGSASGEASSPGVAVDEACPMPDCPPGTACAQVCPTPTEPVPAPTEPMPMPVEPERPADLPSKEEAQRIGMAFLSEAGLDVDGADVRVEDGFSQWMVAAEPRVGGMPTQGFGWSVAVGPKGEIQFANGWLGSPSEGAEYPLAGVDAAVERLKTGGGGWYGGPEPAIAMDMPECVDCEPQVRTITGVRLGLMFSPLWDAEGNATEALLVPSYFFRFDDTEYEQPVIAVADEYLPKPPEGGWAPYPMPVEPGGGAGGSDGQTCTAAIGDGTDGSTEMQLCGPATAEAGEEVTFTFTISSTNGAFISDGCAAPYVRFGDGTDERAICDIGCSPSGEPEKFARDYTHRYEKAGTYAVEGWARGCGEGAGDQTSPRLEVTVRG